MIVKANMGGNLWKLLVSKGDQVEAGQEVAILESMKMEIPITSSYSGTVVDVVKNEGEFVQEDEGLIVLK
ncbi:acetyl-CoA carboxylase biotin carboxyl carrier protein subunit [Alkalihalobacterium alkalinitrilicum]|uniref:acetyl-CoA carboxylase biotin carboxyl carrier protein subunit n=1 Tax=Alkalihalobacterium alkalinitrilicum TaxID=427920 RepID=UPI0009957C5F|nr:acetyl-CoA carboxylase biotin carboxyl carrier protein subunit [Alkalihalobacterium alkalinitrilicum]